MDTYVPMCSGRAAEVISRRKRGRTAGRDAGQCLWLAGMMLCSCRQLQPAGVRSSECCRARKRECCGNGIGVGRRNWGDGQTRFAPEWTRAKGRVKDRNLQIGARKLGIFGVQTVTAVLKQGSRKGPVTPNPEEQGMPKRWQRS